MNKFYALLAAVALVAPFAAVTLAQAAQIVG
jgi:hypothetical protein